MYPFRLGDWDFELSSIGDRGRVVTQLAARHRKTFVSSIALLDYRWYSLLGRQHDRAKKLDRQLLETLVEFAGPEWRTLPDNADIYEALRASPPTSSYRDSFDYITGKEPKRK